MEHRNTRPILKIEVLHPPIRSSDFNQNLKKVTWDMGQIPHPNEQIIQLTLGTS
jgi:hypothetical protein